MQASVVGASWDTGRILPGHQSFNLPVPSRSRNAPSLPTRPVARRITRATVHLFAAVHESAFSTKRWLENVRFSAASRGKADIPCNRQSVAIYGAHW